MISTWRRILARTSVALAGLAGLALLAVVAAAAASRPASSARPNPTGDVGAPGSGAVTVVALADLKARSGVLLEAYRDARDRAADVVVIGGDLVTFDSAFEYRYALRLLELAPPTLPVLVAFGNHEAWDRDQHHSSERFTRTFGPTQGWLRVKGVLFAWADTADYDFPEERAQALDAMLAAERPRSRAAVIVTHELPRFDGGIPPLKDKRGHDKQLKPADTERMRALVEKHDVALVLGGHFHGYAEGRVGRALAIVSGGGGAPLDGDAEFYHYVRVRVGDGPVTHEVVRWPRQHGVEWVRYLLLRERDSALAALGAVSSVALLVAWVAGRGA